MSHSTLHTLSEVEHTLEVMMNNILAQNTPHDADRLTGQKGNVAVGKIPLKYTRVEAIPGIRSVTRLYSQDSCELEAKNELPTPSVEAGSDTKDEPHPVRNLTSIANSIRGRIRQLVDATKSNLSK